jgi:hypothetical protein
VFLFALSPPTVKKESFPLFRLLFLVPDCGCILRGLLQLIKYQKEGIMTATCVSIGSIGATTCRRWENDGLGETGQNHFLLEEITSASSKQSWLVQEFPMQHFENQDYVDTMFGIDAAHG